MRLIKKYMTVEKETEEKIFEAARKVFQQRGFEGARMQEIADEAEINKSMLHYYYRSKDKLFQEVFKVGVKKIFPDVIMILSKEISLKEKTEELVEFYHTVFKSNPHLPVFVVYEMQQHSERFREFMNSLSLELPPVFLEQVNKEVSEGNMIPITPHQFLMNVLSMCLFPMIARNMAMIVFNFTDQEYEDFLDEREAMIPDLIFKGLKFH